MTTVLGVILLLVAVLLLGMAALGVPNAGRVNLLAAGLACWAASQLLVRVV